MCASYQCAFDFMKLSKAFKAIRPKTGFWSLSKNERVKISNLAPVIALDPESGDRVIRMMNWALPRFDMATGKYLRFQIFNARDENVNKYSMFKSHFQKDRILVPVAPAFIEWKDEGKKPNPMYQIGLKGWKPFAFAGFWGTYNINSEGEKEITKRREKDPGYQSPKKAVDCFTFITTTPNDVVKPIHPKRMPVILDPKNYDAWLDPRTPADVLVTLLRQYPAEKMQARPATKALK